MFSALQDICRWIHKPSQSAQVTDSGVEIGIVTHDLLQGPPNSRSLTLVKNYLTHPIQNKKILYDRPVRVS